MSELVPSGYITIADAIDGVGRGLFPTEWTGEEQKARTGLISEDEWSKIKDMPKSTGSGAGRGASTPQPKVTTPHASGDPSDPSYQAEFRASERRRAARHQFRAGLEAGRYEAAILDPLTGALHRAWSSLWRRHNADRMIEKGEAPLPRSPNEGRLYIRRPADNKSAPGTTETHDGEKREILTYRTGAPGRPTSGHLVAEEFKRRVARGDLPSSLRQLSFEMQSWLKEAHPSAAPMTAKVIENSLRARWHVFDKPH